MVDDNNSNPAQPGATGLGLIHIYTGYGKGKTTASLGLAMRAIGQGYKACMIQFLKGGKYTGEYITAHTNLEGLEIYQFGKECVKEDTQLRLDGFSKRPIPKTSQQSNHTDSQQNNHQGNHTMVRGVSFCGECRACFTINEAEKQDTIKGLAFAKKTIASGEYDLVILDEICGAINQDLIKVEDIVELAKGKSKKTELVLTGRDAPKELVALADYVSEIKHVKHPYDKGIEARRGIEF
jgi:cob(I)alamin adenosyltransferase